MLHSLKSFVKNQEFKKWFSRFLLGFRQDAFFNKSKSGCPGTFLWNVKYFLCSFLWKSFKYYKFVPAFTKMTIFNPFNLYKFPSVVSKFAWFWILQIYASNWFLMRQFIVSTNHSYFLLFFQRWFSWTRPVEIY